MIRRFTPLKITRTTSLFTMKAKENKIKQDFRNGKMNVINMIISNNNKKSSLSGKEPQISPGRTTLQITTGGGVLTAPLTFADFDLIFILCNGNKIKWE